MYMGTVFRRVELTIGMIEGVAEAAASVTKVFSGALSDISGSASCSSCSVRTRRAHQTSVPAGDEHRMGVRRPIRGPHRQGIRGAPRDALVTEIVEPRQRERRSDYARHWIRWARSSDPCSPSCSWRCLRNDISAAMWVGSDPGFPGGCCCWSPEFTSRIPRRMRREGNGV